MPLSESLRRWWPLPRSLDLVCGPVVAAAAAVLAEVTRIVAGVQPPPPEPRSLPHRDRVTSAWVPFSSPAGVFGSVHTFTNVPTLFFVLPTHADWAVLWNNSFLCDGSDSLC